MSQDIRPLDATALERLQSDADWAEVFGEGWAQDNCPPLPFTRAGVAVLFFMEDGDYDGSDWVCGGRLSDGRYFIAGGGCDYTGWDCQAGNYYETWDTLDEFLRNAGDEHRARMGVGSALGSMEVPDVC